MSCLVHVSSTLLCCDQHLHPCLAQLTTEVLASQSVYESDNAKLLAKRSFDVEVTRMLLTTCTSCLCLSCAAPGVLPSHSAVLNVQARSEAVPQAKIQPPAGRPCRLC